MKTKTEMQEAMRKRMEEKIEEEKRRLRCTMPLEDLIRTEVHEAADEVRKKQREELQHFLGTRAGQDKDGAEFMSMLQRSKTQFGPYAVKLAEEYFRKQLKRH